MSVVKSSEALNLLLDRLEDAGKLDDPLEVVAAFEAWAQDTGRPLYPHQREAAEQIILEDRHLIAPTPTGSGKSLIGVAGILWALARGGVAYYTAPLKALVSEKFFDLVDLFGATNVGMVTGDGSVNADAPIICATAEILANQALRWGRSLDVDTVVMDEFHYYGDPERGWAWQAPLLLLPQARFVLMSATLGDTEFLQHDLQRRTGREVAVLESAQRPVPLEMEYRVEPVEKLLVELAHQDKFPAYLVHPSQRAAVEEAERIASFDLDLGLDASQLDRLKAELKTVGFNSAFGKTLRPLLLKGIGIHHAGMLPRYRRLVERLAGMGLLKVISGTDTLGVGINVPIRTVVMASLVKFDGSKERHLNAREFHQVAGRAGRAGFDTVGYVFALAPEWEVENAAALAKAGDDPKRQARVKKKKAPEGRTTWTEGTFKRLVESAPGALSPRWLITHAMVLHTLQRPGDQKENLQALAVDNHNVARFGAEVQERFTANLDEILDSLTTSGIISGDSESGYQLTSDLPESFALNQALAPFALDFLQAFHHGEAGGGDAAHETPADQAKTSKIPTGGSADGTNPARGSAGDSADGTNPTRGSTGGSVDGTTPAGGETPFGEVLDIISVVEAVLDDPAALLRSQERAAKDRVFAELKAAGADYEERQAALEKVTYPRPLEAELGSAFEIYAQANPWAKEFRLMPKSILRDMVETGATFTSYIARLGSAFAEGQLLRYLSDAWRALSQIVPPELRVGRFEEVMEWLQDLIRRVDSSLLDEWKYLENPALRAQASTAGNEAPGEGLERAFGQRVDGSFDWLANPAAARQGLSRVLMPWLDALGGDEFELLARLESQLRARMLAPHETTGGQNENHTGEGETSLSGGKSDPSGAESSLNGAESHLSESRKNLTSGSTIQARGSAILAGLPPVGEAGWDKMLGHFWDTHDFLDTGADGRNRQNFQVFTNPQDFPRLPSQVHEALAQITAKNADSKPGHHRTEPDADSLWLGELTLVDGDQDLDFALYIAIDPLVTPTSNANDRGLAAASTPNATDAGATSGNTRINGGDTPRTGTAGKTAADTRTKPATPAWIPLGLFER